MSELMRAVVSEAFGPPESYALTERRKPAPGAGEIRVAVHAAGVSFVDALIAAGEYQVKPPLPFTPGSEYSGVVDAVGDGVSDLKAGDRVAGSAFGGALGEYNVVAATAVYRVPPGMAFDEASVFRVSYATAYHALVQRARVQPGETLLVLGAGGATGFAAIQLGKALGMRVIGSASSAAKRDLAIEGGADAAIDSRAADWRDQIKKLTDGKGVDVVFDPVGGPATELAFRSLGWRGRHLVIGFASGEIGRLPANLPLLKGAELVGVDIRQFGIFEPERSRKNMDELLDLYAKGAISPRIVRKFPLESFVDAMKAAASGELAGRIVVAVR